MAYATLDDVADRLIHVTLGDPYYNELRPTEDDVTEWLDEISDGAIDPVVRTLTALPVTDDAGLAFLKELCIELALSRVYSVLENAEQAELHKKSFDDQLKLLLKTPAILSSTASAGSPTHGFTREEAEFRRGESQW